MITTHDQICAPDRPMTGAPKLTTRKPLTSTDSPPTHPDSPADNGSAHSPPLGVSQCASAPLSQPPGHQQWLTRRQRRTQLRRDLTKARRAAKARGHAQKLNRGNAPEDDLSKPHDEGATHGPGRLLDARSSAASPRTEIASAATVPGVPSRPSHGNLTAKAAE